MSETTETQPTLDDAGLGGLRFKAYPRRLLKIKSQFGQNIQQNSYDSIILLVLRRFLWKLGGQSPIGVTDS